MEASEKERDVRSEGVIMPLITVILIVIKAEVSDQL